MGIFLSVCRGTIFTLAFGVMLAAPDPSAAVDTPTPSIARSAAPAVRAGPPRVPRLSTRAVQPKAGKLKRNPSAAQSKRLKRSDTEFLQRYRTAHALILQNNDHAAGIDALRALKKDGHPDVANLIGFASRKLLR